MKLGQATEADAHPLAIFLVAQLGDVAHRISPAFLRDRIKKGTIRFPYLQEADAITAVIGATHIHTEDGPGWFIDFLVVAQDHPDKIKALDAVTLYALNISASEVVHVIVGAATSDEFSYGRDLLQMTPDQQGTNVKTGKPADTYWVRGDAKAMIRRILERRPEWRL